MLLAGYATMPAHTVHQSSATPQSVVDELLAADRAFSDASASMDVVAGLGPMFAPDVVMGPIPGNTFARGRDAAVAALRANPDNATMRATWTPIRGGISADGQHGFTFGYMTLRRTDGSANLAKYLAYWVKRPEGWRVAVYKRGRRSDGPVPTEPMPPALPARIVPVTSDANVIERHRASLDQAERAFSDEAQIIGLGPAFAKHGSADAVNLGGPNNPAFVVGAEAIGKSVGANSPPPGSPLSWAPDQVIVASSGDLGVTIGVLRPNTPGPDGKPGPLLPFFTIWRRATAVAPWLYIAE